MKQAIPNHWNNQIKAPPSRYLHSLKSHRNKLRRVQLSSCLSVNVRSMFSKWRIELKLVKMDGTNSRRLMRKNTRKQKKIGKLLMQKRKKNELRKFKTITT